MSQEDARTLTDYPHLNPLIEALGEVKSFLQTLKLGSEVVFAPLNLRTDHIIATTGPRHRIFPRQFYHQFLNPNDPQAEGLAKLAFEVLGQRLSGYAISPNALAILAHVSRSNWNRKIKTFNQKDAYELAGLFIQQQENRGRLPIFKDFFRLNPRTFVALMSSIRFRLAVDLGHLGLAEDDREVFELKLTRALAADPESDLRQQVQMAEDLVEAKILPHFRQAPELQWLLNPRPGAKRRDHWFHGGRFFLTFEAITYQRDFVNSGPKILHEIEASTDRHFASYSVRYSDKSNAREVRLFSDWFDFFSNQILQKHNEQHKVIRDQVQSEMKALIDQLRDFAREERTALERATIELRQAQAAPVSTYSPKRSIPQQTVPKSVRHHTLPSDPQEVPAGTKLTAKSDTTTGNEVSSSPEQPIEGSLPISELSSFSHLKPDQLYYFLDFSKPQGRTDRTYSYQYLKISSSILAALNAKNLSGEKFLKLFLGGPVAPINSNGLKRLRGGTLSAWEIKDKAIAHRIIVKQDKAQRLWTWLDLVAHNAVTHYIQSHF